MNRIRGLCVSAWLAFVSVISPVWLGIAYMYGTGHGKGYGYNLGSEADISAGLGMIFLGLWILATVPAMLWLRGKLRQKRKALGFLPAAGFLALFALAVCLMGWGEFISMFGYFGAA